MLFSSQIAFAEEIVVRAPICSGYDTSKQQWIGIIDSQSDNWECPDGSALFSVDAHAAFYLRELTQVPIRGSCCPLPDGALSSIHRFAEDSCPEGFVATGTKREATHDSDANGRDTRERHLLRCTRLTSEFHLEPRKPGWILGSPEDPLRALGTKPWQVEVKRTVAARVPMGLRYGLLRSSQYDWLLSGCIGHPWGSVFVGRRYASCTGADFQEIRKHTMQGHSRETVRFIPCEKIDDPYSVTPLCLDTN